MILTCQKLSKTKWYPASPSLTIYVFVYSSYWFCRTNYVTLYSTNTVKRYIAHCNIAGERLKFERNSNI